MHEAVALDLQRGGGTPSSMTGEAGWWVVDGWMGGRAGQPASQPGAEPPLRPLPPQNAEVPHPPGDGAGRHGRHGMALRPTSVCDWTCSARRVHLRINCNAGAGANLDTLTRLAGASHHNVGPWAQKGGGEARQTTTAPPPLTNSRREGRPANATGNRQRLR